jgi:hypothetical protein
LLGQDWKIAYAGYLMRGAAASTFGFLVPIVGRRLVGALMLASKQRRVPFTEGARRLECVILSGRKACFGRD